MAPPPEYDKEPKAPDKITSSLSCEDPIEDLIKDQPTSTDLITTSVANAPEVENNPHVESLDDGQLRALLDEAINYKSPKDREGKSVLFQELLQEAVEKDEAACEAAGRAGRGARRAGGGVLSASMQDLVAAALAAEPAHPSRRRPHHPNVSARAIHGGSLPSGVDTTFLASEEPIRVGKEYVATVQCVNPSPHFERRVSISDAHSPQEMEQLNRSKPVFPITYTSCATLEIGSRSVCSGRAVTTTTASNQVDSSISFSCITTPEVVASCNTTSCTTQSAVAVDAKPRSVIADAVNGLPLPRAAYGATTSAQEDNKKSLDENGNSVQGLNSPLSGSSQHKKPRRKKSSKNETVINLHQIDGYQGNKDLNELLRFIEADNGRGQKLTRSKHKDDSEDKNGKKRSTERRKEKEKMKRANSMEELSRTKLEDLTDKPELSLRSNKKERWPEGSGPKAERRSWGDDARESFFYREREPVESAPETSAETTLELTDFQTVTKKRKPRKRTEDSDREAAGGDPPPRPRAPSPRSNDSNDDMDSVHSLPADPSQTRPNIQLATHASYADIARTRHNIPDLIESCNFYAEGETGDLRTVIARNEEPTAVAPVDADGYPALEAKAARRRETKKRKEREIAPDVVADRRPAVILLDSGDVSGCGDMEGVTFGFDVNEQLVGRARRCDLVRDATRAVPVEAGGAALTYLPPKLGPNTNHLHQIIDYVGNAWADVIRCGSGIVRYYSE